MKGKIVLGLVTIILCFSLVGMPNPGKVNAQPNQPDTLCSGSGLMGCWLLDEATGATTADGSGNGNTGTLMPVGTPPTWVNALYKYGLQFNGSTQYVQVAHPGTVDIHSALTITAWVKPGANTTQHLVQKGISTGGTPTLGGYELSLSSVSATPAQKVFFRLNYGPGGSNTYRIDTNTTYPVGTWIFVAGTYDPDDPSNIMHIYFNGVQDDDNVTPGPDSILAMDTDLNLARDPGGGYGFQGVMDEVKIFNRALSAAEILTLYQDTTAVNLVNFNASSRPQGIQLNWQTAHEMDLLGFNLYRAEALDGLQVKVNPQLIPAMNPGQFQGNAYRYLDATAGAYKSYYYWVEWVGNRDIQLYGPVTANLVPFWLWLPFGFK
jgi:hypothetical protein